MLNNDLNLIPSVMIQYWQPQLMGAHINVKMQYLDQIWVGASYRIFRLPVWFTQPWRTSIFLIRSNVSYAYEVATTSRLRNYTGNTHEIMVGFILGNKFGIPARNVW